MSPVKHQCLSSGATIGSTISIRIHNRDYCLPLFAIISVYGLDIDTGPQLCVRLLAVDYWRHHQGYRCDASSNPVVGINVKKPLAESQTS
jgi:hypothetical protein